ncbi:MAG TPA: glycosyltransferase family 4 protein [Jatrophihabitans sp.]|jgi:glycosyltransferase involved in cell wall biosynthesis
MRIAHVTDCYLPRLGGIERQVLGLASAQQALGHDVEVITSVATGATAPDSVVVHRPPGGRRRGVSEGSQAISYGSSLQGRRTLLEGGYDAVHVHASTFSPLGYLAARATAGKVPTVLTLHSLWSRATPIFSTADLFLRWRQWPIAWSAVSSVAAHELAGVIGSGTPVSVLPNAVTPALWRTRERVSTDPTRLVIVTTMRLASRKRPLQFLAMMRQVRQRVPSNIRIDVKIIGDGPLGHRMHNYLLDHQMNGWVQMLGELSAAQIRREYERADIYVSPATLESFGIAAMEARCAGLPVVAFAQTGVSDFIRNGREGLLVSSDRDMARAVISLATSPELRATISRHNRRTEPLHSWLDVTERAEELYERARLLTNASPRVRALR